MSWGKIITIAVTVLLVAGGGLWAYTFFEAPESIDSITAKWEGAGHADTTSESFVHWNEDDPPEIPANCAKCHSLYGYLDYLGADGSEARQVDAAHKTGTVLYCNTCHNEVGHTMSSVVFPSGAEVTDLWREANCMRCHQGRASTARVNQATEGIDADAVSEDLGFINVHYAVGAATRRGTDVQGGYEYAGRSYVGWYEHVEDFDTCIECHDPHSTDIDPAACEPCHANVTNYGEIFEIRESETDYDGDGDTEEGILSELEALHTTLYGAIQAYAGDVAGTPIVYADSFPYWFVDSNGNGEADGDEANFGNRYASWTPRLVRATYNYHYFHEDPGAFTHNADYVLQLLYDAVADLGEQVPVDNGDFSRP
jgi:hypothetical protein